MMASVLHNQLPECNENNQTLLCIARQSRAIPTYLFFGRLGVGRDSASGFRNGGDLAIEEGVIVEA